jgi:hypothetical protein
MDDGYYVSFIIWKDYNCNGWASINYNTIIDQNAGIDTFPSTLGKTFINSFATDQQDDPWGVAVSMITSLQNYNAAFQGNDKAFTIIVSQSTYAKYFAKICSLHFMYYPKYYIGNNIHWGKIILLQMR